MNVFNATTLLSWSILELGSLTSVFKYYVCWEDSLLGKRIFLFNLNIQPHYSSLK